MTYAEEEMIRMLLADSNGTFRLGIRTMLGKENMHLTIDEVENRAELMMKLRSCEYEVLMVDPLLAGGTGEGLIKHMSAIAPKSNILAFTTMDEVTHGLRVIRSGAKGYLMKTCSSDELKNAVTRVGSGRMHISSVLSEEIASHLFKTAPDKLHNTLTEREWQVFSMLVWGKTITETGREFCLSVKTISTHKVRLMRKLKVTNTSEIVQYAISQDLMKSCRTRCLSFCTN
jgi:DNA-binding NarL/FixJ family response regulator